MRLPQCGFGWDSALSRTTGHDGWMAQRDRDESGRPRSARPRDALGRPLPPGSAGVPRVPDDLVLEPAETLAYAQDLLDRGLAFNAHEVLEAAWKNGPVDEQALWQGLAQLAVGLRQAARGAGDVAGGEAGAHRGAPFGEEWPYTGMKGAKRTLNDR